MTLDRQTIEKLHRESVRRAVTFIVVTAIGALLMWVVCQYLPQ